ncbi:hypothetical protein N658DRAFT_561528 [Parathielavia hyrcaniae]|uniref:RING-CH-type domain-containing protein n=1 Tax=Parathielavia hyrcaniae TaxID=113614 RepID=A0AAN6SXV7_9PEZI|nr:hypothetical protein N658DRAFT_561528 [Parathielavia hyrcaniae]
MATPSSDSTAAVPQPTPTARNRTPSRQTITPIDHRICFVCLHTDKDIPNAEWCSACPCTLDAHSACMLRWIAEMEMEAQRYKHGLRCPACKHPIRLEEPYDPVVALRDHLYRQYSHLAPYTLFGIVSGGALAGSVAYGVTAASAFAGPDVVARWAGFDRHPQSGMALAAKFWLLSSIGPGLVLLRWMPSLGSVLLVPFSVVFGAVTIAHDQIPPWPPSPQWAMALMPFVHLSYATLVHNIFGPLERRLNSALHGQFATEELAAPVAEGQATLAAVQPVARRAYIGYEGQRPYGIFTFLTNISVAAVYAVGDLFFGEEPEEERRGGMELRGTAIYEGGRLVAGGGEGFYSDAESGSEDEDEYPHLEDDAAEQEQQLQLQLQLQRGPEEPTAAEGQPTLEAGEAAVDILWPEPVNDQDSNNDDVVNNNTNNRNQPDDVYNDPPTGATTLTRIINSIATSLLFPAISYGMGELIRAAVPRAWVAGARKAGLLQERWGRSLAGGCLFVVLRDALSLYTKYRRVRVRAGRRVKNVEKKARVSRVASDSAHP